MNDAPTDTDPKKPHACTLCKGVTTRAKSPATHIAFENGKRDPVAYLCDDHVRFKQWNWNVRLLNPPEPPTAPEKKKRAPKAKPQPAANEPATP